MLSWFSSFITRLVATLEQAFLHLIQPARHSIALSIAADLPRSKSELIAEKALLRQQLIIIQRQIKRMRFTPSDRLWLVLLVSRVQHWKDMLLILKPDTVLHWHRQGFRLFWKFKSRKRGGRPKLSIETINLIQQMAKENLLWGAERIRGELLKLDLKVATTTIQKYIRLARPRRAPSQSWSVFLNNHCPRQKPHPSRILHQITPGIQSFGCILQSTKGFLLCPTFSSVSPHCLKEFFFISPN